MTLHFNDEQVDRLRQTKADIEWIRRQVSPDSSSHDHLDLIERHIDLVIDQGTGTTPNDWRPK